MSQDKKNNLEQSPEQEFATGRVSIPEGDAALSGSSNEGSASACSEDETRVLPVVGASDKASSSDDSDQARGKDASLPCENAKAEQGASSAEAAKNDSAQADPDEPFEASGDDSVDLAEVIARDERSATLPPHGTSSVATALEQRPPRLAKGKRGPRTAMLEELIPEVVIPTDALETKGFNKVRVVEASQLEKPKVVADEEEKPSSDEAPKAEESEQASADAASDAQSEETKDASESETASSGDAPKRPSMRTRSGRPRPTGRGKAKKTPSSRIAAAVLALVLILAVVAGGAFTWDRWYRFDDAQDILGEWKMTNAERTMVITEKTLKIAEGVAYEYSLDTKKKTITYSFGEDKLTATYRFSPDRQCLIIDESCETDWLVALHLKEDPVLVDRDVPKGVSKLSKLSGDTKAEPKDTEEIREDESIWTGNAWVDGYFDYKRPDLKDDDEDEEESKKKKDSEDGDEEEETDEYEDGAVYVDEETGNRFYYDSSQVLYYDVNGNYYYDMYGNNPYTQPVG